MKTANEFYRDCIDGFIAVAQSFGYANAGMLGDEVLMRRAEQAVRELLKIRPLIKALGNNPTMYYYEVNGFAFAMGVTLAMLKMNAPEKFRERDIITMIAHDPETSPHELAFTALQQFGMDVGIYNQLVQEIYRKFLDLHAPYWQAKEPRDYTLAAFYASFMTGCSISIEKFNERRAQKQFAKVEVKSAKVAEGKKTSSEKNESEKKVATKRPALKKPRKTVSKKGGFSS